jgi:hypothetical protein
MTLNIEPIAHLGIVVRADRVHPKRHNVVVRILYYARKQKTIIIQKVKLSYSAIFY